MLFSRFARVFTLTALFASSLAFAASAPFTYKLPKGWKVLSDSASDGLGFEFLVGRSFQDYTRVYVSGDALAPADFKQRMEGVIRDTKADRKDDLLNTPEVVPYGDGGLMAKIVFKSDINGKPYVEAHYPLVVNGKGADLNLVVPFKRWKQGVKELEEFVASLRFSWAK